MDALNTSLFLYDSDLQEPTKDDRQARESNITSLRPSTRSRNHSDAPTSPIVVMYGEH